jgi:hypothetical protein
MMPKRIFGRTWMWNGLAELEDDVARPRRGLRTVATDGVAIDCRVDMALG